MKFDIFNFLVQMFSIYSYIYTFCKSEAMYSAFRL